MDNVSLDELLALIINTFPDFSSLSPYSLMMTAAQEVGISPLGNEEDLFIFMNRLYLAIETRNSNKAE
jgi:hypothetical protein